jgi:chromosome segregation ATPase
MASIIEISDNELFELLGKKDCEIYTNEKTIKAYKIQLDKIKEVILQMELLKKAKIDLETSNKSLADTNIKLDQALTEARKERDALKTELQTASYRNGGLIKEKDILKVEIENLTVERNSYKLQWEEASTKYDKLEVKDVNHRKGKKRTISNNSNG